MNKDVKNFGILILLLVAILLLLWKRKGQVSVVSHELRDSMGNLLSASSGEMRDQLNNQLIRICNYGGASLEWNTTDACPPMYSGLSLLSDTLTPKV